jgi:hypothetical protein
MLRIIKIKSRNSMDEETKAQFSKITESMINKTQDNIKISSSAKFAIFTLITMISIIGLSDQNAFADTTPPVITLIGANSTNATLNSAYTDLGATAVDSLGNDITANIVTVSDVDTSVVGRYRVTYDVQDSSGNAAIQVTRAVNVVTAENDIKSTELATVGTENITSTTSAGTFNFFTPVSESLLTPQVEGTKPPGLSFEFGLFSFELSGLAAGGSADITLNFSDNLPPGTQYWEVIDGKWTNISDKATISGNTIILHMTDGSGADDDRTPGTITDPGGPVIITAKHSSGSIVPREAVPSLGGTETHHFTDGLTINGKIFDIGHYITNIPQQQFKIGQPVSITIKSEPVYGANTWQHVAAYFDFNGNDLLVSNADTALISDKKDGFQSIDPNGFISNAAAVTKTTPDTVYTTFTFTVKKQMDDTSIIIRVWDDYRYTLDAKVLGAIVFGELQKPPEPAKIPDYMKIYTTLKDADNAVEGTGFIKPVLFAHISTTSQIWSEPNMGHVLWFFDTKDNEVARIIYGINGNMIKDDVEKLVQAPKILIGKDTSYAGNHLDRNIVAQMEQAQKDPEYKGFVEYDHMNYGYVKDGKPVKNLT